MIALFKLDQTSSDLAVRSHFKPERLLNYVVLPVNFVADTSGGEVWVFCLKA